MPSRIVALIWMLVICFCVVNATEARQPNVFILINDVEAKDDDESLSSFYWSVPGRVTNLAALIYGKTPLECGVVSDLDWRRKPVMALSIADCYRKAGYHTSFFGTWGMGLAAPYDPASRGFDSVWISSDGTNKTLEEMVFDSPLNKEKLIASMPKDKPWFSIVRQGKSGRDSVKLLNSMMSGNDHKEGIIITVIPEGAKISPAFGYSGKFPQIQARTIGELYSGLVQFIGGEPGEVMSPYVFYHQGHWPLADSPEKHRHRGSIVLGDKFALSDGLQLYPMKAPLMPVTDNLLDIGVHAMQHQKLLVAHSNWWQRASKAINNPRPFDIGVVDGEVVRLTALDWRPSKIIHKDETSPSSKPVVYKSDLFAMLHGLRDNELYKQSFPSYSGSWAVNITRSGRYKITARLLPEQWMKSGVKELAMLQGGQAYIKLGNTKVQLGLTRGATAVSVLIDADRGVTNLECWFTGQLSLERELGAFFVDIERIGDKEHDFQLKFESPNTE